MPSALDTQALDALNPRLSAAIFTDIASIDDDETSPEYGTVILCNPSVNVLPGEVCADVICHYTGGNCALLALMIHDEVPETELVLVLRGSAPAVGPWDEAHWCHMLVRLPDGRLLDIEGIQDEGELLERWASFHSVREPVRLQSVTLDESAATCGSVEDVHVMEREMARTYGIVLLRKAGVLEGPVPAIRSGRRW